ncbi:MAG: hypothetical protein IJQ98_09105, partial [Oscillospiraceae bacterium]|nr:hypothetical protein [Oscillospiraceae bacterium]
GGTPKEPPPMVSRKMLVSGVKSDGGSWEAGYSGRRQVFTDKPKPAAPPKSKEAPMPSNRLKLGD